MFTVFFVYFTNKCRPWVDRVKVLDQLIYGVKTDGRGNPLPGVDPTVQPYHGLERGGVIVSEKAWAWGMEGKYLSSGSRLSDDYNRDVPTLKCSAQPLPGRTKQDLEGEGVGEGGGLKGVNMCSSHLVRRSGCCPSR